MSVNVTGTWFNQLGSQMQLTAFADGSLTGRYSSAVGNAVNSYTLVGRFDTSAPSGKGTTLGFDVTWKNKDLNAHSSTTWSGQFFSGNSTGTGPVILTQWLLTRSTTLEDLWNSVTVGHDEFSLVEPSAEVKKRAMVLNRGSNFPPSLDSLD
ncbi:tamavidin1 [Pterulicium gracile]|uniref:Tamavidin1 n=1 Tax=Pterulicium gracile TaxID=1884261 RepID=A0A5C3Q6X7_9AGAR|nr:tamavidin1 [Pterula gracilis]